MVGYPGTGFYPQDYDPRDHSWYTGARHAEGPVWSALDADESGLGLLLTCAVALHDADGNEIGVAAVDLTFGHIINNLMEPPEGAQEAWLINAQGQVIVRSSQRDVARSAPEGWTPPPFPYPELLARIQSKQGHLDAVIDGVPQLVLWHRIDRMGWIYLVHGPLEQMMYPDRAVSAPEGPPKP